MQSCLAVVKASILVIQKSQESISACLHSEQSHCMLRDTLSSLLGCYTHILTDGKKQSWISHIEHLRDVNKCNKE